MLILQRKAGESVVIGEDITIQVLSIDGMRVRLAISAPEDVPILRRELITATAANRDSAMEETAPSELLELLGGVLDQKREERPSSQALEQIPESPEGKED